MRLEESIDIQVLKREKIIFLLFLETNRE